MLDPSVGLVLVRPQVEFALSLWPFDFPILADHAPVGKSTDVVVPGILVGNIARGADAMR